jgi:hypothetical protein
MYALPFAVGETALELERGNNRVSRLSVSLPLLVVGILGVETFEWFLESVRANEGRVPGEARSEERDPALARRRSPPLAAIRVFVLLFLQFEAVVWFFFMLDGHVHFRVACWVYLAYAAGVLLVLATKRGRPTGWWSRYLRWGWAPVLAAGVPLLLPILKDTALAPFSPIQLHW